MSKRYVSVDYGTTKDTTVLVVCALDGTPVPGALHIVRTLVVPEPPPVLKQQSMDMLRKFLRGKR